MILNHLYSVDFAFFFSDNEFKDFVDLFIRKSATVFQVIPTGNAPLHQFADSESETQDRSRMIVKNIRIVQFHDRVVLENFT